MLVGGWHGRGIHGGVVGFADVMFAEVEKCANQRLAATTAPSEPFFSCRLHVL